MCNLCYYHGSQTLIALLMTLCCLNNVVNTVADDDDPSGYSRAGMKICPCFCSVRTGDDQSPYWDEHFGDEVLNEKNLPAAQCATSSCLDPSYTQHMTYCKDYVNYHFCPRKFNGVNNTNTAEYIKALDAHAEKCTESTVTMEYESANIKEHEKTCLSNIRAGACYIVFPTCTSTNIPVGTCSSFCVHERTGCRSTGSTYGHRDYLTSNCQNDGRFVNSVETKVCTGGASALFHFGEAFFNILLVLLLSI